MLNLRVRGSSGQMVPFSAFTKVHWMQGATQLQRYNGYPSLTISGQAAPGESSGTALKEMEKIADQILKGSQSYEWTGTAFEEKQAGGQIGLLLGLSLIVVFLLLVGLYNSWAIPLSVLLVVPFGVLGAVLFTMLRGLSADVYFNIGLITIIGLAAKNAILVVEFAIEDEVGDRTPLQATLEAARQRLRPILMTSLAFILGMVPLVIAGGAGSASRHAVGTGVMGGMIAATAFGIFFTPLFYFAARKWLSRASVHHASDAEEPKPLPGAVSRLPTVSRSLPSPRLSPPRSQPARCLRISDGANISPIHGYRPISPPRSRITVILPSRSQGLRRRGRNTGYRMQSVCRS